MKKRILILGAGEAQMNLIRSALKLGYYTIVCDMRPDTEASRIADKYNQKNYMDHDAILEIAKCENIDGVISNSEPAMSSVSYLVDQLGLPGNSTDSLQNLLSKTRFRQLQEECGVFCPKSFTGGDAESLLNAAKTLCFPVIIKPSESSGSRGATKVEAFSEEHIRDAFQVCQEFSRNDQVTIEEFVEMESLQVVNADVFVAGREILWDGWYGGLRSGRKPMIPMAKVLPPMISPERQEIIRRDVDKLLRAADVSLGEFNVETYFSPRGDLFVIEINPRQAGDDIPKLIYEHTGVDLTKLLVTLTVADNSYFEYLKTFVREENYITLQVVFCHQDGIYQNLFLDDRIKPFVRWIHEFVQTGDRVYDARNAEDSVAYVDLRFETKEQQLFYTNNIENMIYPVMKGKSENEHEKRLP